MPNFLSTEMIPLDIYMYVCVCVKLHAQTKVKFIREVVIERLAHTCSNIWKHINTIQSLESQFIYNAKGLYNFSEKKKKSTFLINGTSLRGGVVLS